MDSQKSEDVCFMCVGWGHRGSKLWVTSLPLPLHHLHGLSLCCLSDAGDGGQAVWWLLEFLRLCGGGFWDGAKAKWQSDTTGANVAGAQRRILPSIAFHYAGCVGCKAFTCPAQETTESKVFGFNIHCEWAYQKNQLQHEWRLVYLMIKRANCLGKRQSRCSFQKRS